MRRLIWLFFYGVVLICYSCNYSLFLCFVYE